MRIEYRAIECTSATDALQEADASGLGEAILLAGKPMVVPPADCRWLEEAGVEFAYLHNRQMPDGSYRIVTVPIN
jgi:hypothetical protein